MNVDNVGCTGERLCRVATAKQPNLHLPHLVEFICITLIHLLLTTTGLAEVNTDGSVGVATHLTGPSFQIGQDLGTRVGDNLFHSFSQFNINHNESATFTGDGNIQNVISRVTGGNVSVIDGLFRSEIGQAAVYFINPAGIVFGNNAQVDVPAAFYTSTAAVLNFTDGAQFNALNPVGSHLSMAAPSAFGFNTDQTGSIVIEADNMVFKPQSKVEFAAHEIDIQQAKFGGTNIDLTLSTVNNADIPSGSINIHDSTIGASGDGAGQIQINTADLNLKNTNLYIEKLGTGKTQSSEALYLKANNIYLDHSIVDTSSAGGVNGGDIQLEATGKVNIVNASRLSSGAYSSGNSGNITVNTKDLDIIGTDSEFTGIFSTSLKGTGGAGNVTVNALNNVNISSGGQINASTQTSGSGGNVTINTDNLAMDAQNNKLLTQITSASLLDSGNAGNIEINARNSVNIQNGAWINSSTRASGAGGKIDLFAKDLLINGQNNPSATGVFSNTFHGSGNAGSINIAVANALNLLNGGRISSVSLEEGNAGSIVLNVGDVTIDGQNSKFQTGIISSAYSGLGNAGRIELISNNDVHLLHGGLIDSTTNAVGNGGDIIIKTQGNILIDDQQSGIDTGIVSRVTEKASGNAGDISINAQGNITMVHGSQIISGTHGTGLAGDIQLVSGKNIVLDALNSTSKESSGISSEASSLARGDAGNVKLFAGKDLNILNGAWVSSATYGLGSAGKIDVTADNLMIAHALKAPLFGILSIAYPYSRGNAGQINVYTLHDSTLSDGGEINSSTYGSGSANNVSLQSDGNIFIDGNQNDSRRTGVISETMFEFGQAGNVAVKSGGDLVLVDGGRIDTSTWDYGNAGNIVVHTGGNLFMRGQQQENLYTGIFSDANPYSSGNAGSVKVNVLGDLNIVNNASIETSTYGNGSAGKINITTERNILVDGYGGDYITGVFSKALSDSSGNAGDINISGLGNINIINGGQIDSSTQNVGAAGDVLVEAGQNILINGMDNKNGAGIFSTSSIGHSDATDLATGSVGSVKVKADKLLRLENKGVISISYNTNSNNASQLQTKTLTVEAPDIELLNGSRILATASGNAAASEIRINTNSLNLVDFPNNFNKGARDGISTSAQNGNGGAITIAAKDWVQLKNSVILTSVTGSSGNGGNISINSDVIVLDTGFIQANTKAKRAIGGDIKLNHASLILSRENNNIEATKPIPFAEGLNVIQAVGERSGIISYVAPELNIVSGLAGLTTPTLDSTFINFDPCAVSQHNSLKYLGQGGIKELNQGQDNITIDLLFEQAAITPEFHLGTPLNPGIQQQGCQKSRAVNNFASFNF